jgi:hypothetical protein
LNNVFVVSKKDSIIETLAKLRMKVDVTSHQQQEQFESLRMKVDVTSQQQQELSMRVGATSQHHQG